MTPHRVVQWTTGNVGRRTARAVLDHPDLELVGCFAWSPDKAGRDVGDLIGTGPTGVVASGDAGALLDLRPDCVVYTPKWIDVDEVVRILEAGVNVVATAAFVTGHGLGEGARGRIIEACERGGSSMFGSGMNPGFANLLGIVLTNVCDRVDCVSVTESVDSTIYESPETEIAAGFSLPIDDPRLPEIARQGTAVFEDVVRLTADALGTELDDVTFAAEFAQTTEPLVMESWTIEAGCVAGVKASWTGVCNGSPVVKLNVLWRKGQTLDPDWQVEHGYIVEVAGQPSLRTKVEMYPPPYFEAETIRDFMGLGMIATGMPAVHAIPAVCDARPGIVTYLDLPLLAARGSVR